MINSKKQYLLRKPEPSDIPSLYIFKNDQQISSMLGGFHSGYSESDIDAWIETHKLLKNEVLWVIADSHDNSCLGHVGLYNIDHRIRSAEFGLLIGRKDKWGIGLGSDITKEVLHYGFSQLNLNRISLTVLQTNNRACSLYQKLGFVPEGTLRSAQFKDGRYVDLLCFSLLRDEYIYEH